MRMDYSPSGVAQGRINQSKAQEQPNTFATESGAENVTQMSNLDKPKQRMAEQMGHRIMEYMNTLQNVHVLTVGWICLDYPIKACNSIKLK